MALKATCPTLAKIKDDEPMFVLRAQDMLAPEIVRAWANLLVELGRDPTDPKVTNALDCADAMGAWQQKNAAKIPD